MEDIKQPPTSTTENANNHHKKTAHELVVSICVLVVVLIIAFIAQYFIKPPAGNDVNNQQVATKTESLEVIKIEDKTAPFLDITAEYPSAGVGAKYVEKTVYEIIAEFKKQNDFSKLSQTDLDYARISADSPYPLYIKYAFNSGTHTVTHRLDSYAFTGGAHGGTFVETFTFNKDGNGQNPVLITDLFTDSKKALDLISKKSTESIKNNPTYKDGLPTDWFDEGIAPTIENYSAFEISDDSLIIIFQQYQIMAYVYGNIEVRIPLTDLAQYLKPEYK